MKLAVYWQLGKHRLALGRLEVDQAFIELLLTFEQESGLVINYNGPTKLYPSQWKHLLAVAYLAGYKRPDLKQIQIKFPKQTHEGVLFFEPD